MNKIPKILVIDDNEFNLELMSEILTLEGYEVVSASCGKTGIELAGNQNPDVIILDIIMPEINGWEVCEILQKNPDTKYIPILMVSAKSSLRDLIKSLEEGASEFLPKPFENEELIIRVKSLLRIKNLEDELREINSNLSDEVYKRTQKLVEIEKFEMLGKMVGSLGHDMNNMLANIKIDNQMALLTEKPEKRLDFLISQQKSILVMESFIKSLMSVYTNGNAEMSRFSPYEKIKEVFEFLERKLNRKMIKTQIKCDEDEIKIYANPSQFLQICMNLTINSMDAIDHDHGIIRFEIKKTDENITIIQSDNGCGIDADDIENIFDLMYTTKPVGEGTGIGLFTFKKIMENHGGKFSVKSEKGKGAEFTFTFPLIKTGIDYSKFLK